jgi:hypothetical protein
LAITPVCHRTVFPPVWLFIMAFHHGFSSWLFIMAFHHGFSSWLFIMAFHHGFSSDRVQDENTQGTVVPVVLQCAL